MGVPALTAPPPAPPQVASAALPLVLVVDDELGSAELFAGRPGFGAAQQGRLEQRECFCRRFGLVARAAARGPSLQVDRWLGRDHGRGRPVGGHE